MTVPTHTPRISVVLRIQRGVGGPPGVQPLEPLYRQLTEDREPKKHDFNWNPIIH